MKKLSIEEKAKAYDKAYEKVAVRFGSNVADGIFIEESEDEKIRKELIDFIYDKTDTYELREKSNSWLAWLEKQGEQKHTDKIESKFKVGDWLIYNTPSRNPDICIVTEITDDLCKNRKIGEDRIRDNSIEFVNRNYRLWTIQDAKAGDVLSYSDSRHTWLCIFKELKNQRCYDYCSYRNKDEIGFWPRSNWNYDKTLSYKPATKEQRDLLFQKMKEAGYEWDAEKKELKKIKKAPQKFMVGDTIKYNGTEYKITEITPNGYKVYALTYDEDAASLISFSAPAILVEQNPAWSEEDEQITLSIEQVMNCASLLNIVPEKTDKIRTWLKSIKQRIRG